jgi:hypothetical protein
MRRAPLDGKTEVLDYTGGGGGTLVDWSYVFELRSPLVARFLH